MKSDGTKPIEATDCQSYSPHEGRHVKYGEYNPHEVLQDTVKCFWIHEGSYPNDSKLDITPDRCVELIFNFGS